MQLIVLWPTHLCPVKWLMSRMPIRRTQSFHPLWRRTARTRTETVRKMRTLRNWKQCHVSVSAAFWPVPLLHL